MRNQERSCSKFGGFSWYFGSNRGTHVVIETPIGYLSNREANREEANGQLAVEIIEKSYVGMTSTKKIAGFNRLM